jgi:hypothetical protein
MDLAGWLSFCGKEDASFCYVIDNAGKRYDQNLFLLSNVTDVIVQNYLIILRRREQDISGDVIEIYLWRSEF